MPWRRSSSAAAFAIGVLLLGAALATLAAAWLLPAESMEDLGRIVMAMLLAALAVIPFGIAIALGGGLLPRWMLVTSIAGAALGLLPAIGLLTVRLA